MSMHPEYGESSSDIIKRNGSLEKEWKATYLNDKVITFSEDIMSLWVWSGERERSKKIS